MTPPASSAERAVRSKVRLAGVIAANAVLLTGIAAVLWYQDGQYSLPTPRPKELKQPGLGSRISLPPELAAVKRAGRPLVVHFASPRCPCTEFNLEHVRRLQKLFGAQVDFVTALQTDTAPERADSEFAALHLEMPVITDRDGGIGALFGVYSTPQAVILDGQGRLYFRGNYNRSRYCSDESSEYARIALGALSRGRPLPLLPPEAQLAYGCPLPKHKLSRPIEGEQL